MKNKQAQPPTLSGKEELILDMLACNESYGLDLVNSSNGKLKKGTVYVTLSRMEDKGFIESKLEEAPAGSKGPARRTYKATGYGARALQIKHLMKDAFIGHGVMA